MKGQRKVSTQSEYLASLDEPRKSDVAALDALVRRCAPELEPFIHSGMLAYGPFHYRYASGREGDWFRIGIASNAAYISLYCCAADERGYVAERFKDLLPGAKIGRSCVRFKKLAALDVNVLAQLIRETAQTGFGL